jgi:hypothetical protein
MRRVALLHNPRLSRVVALCVAGVLACGVSLALAGQTPQPPKDPLDALPAGVVRVRSWTCATDLFNAVTPTVSTTEAPGPTVPTACWHIALVRSPTETPNEVADRLAKHYTERGFEFSGADKGEIRALTGTLGQCGTTVAIDTGDQAAFLPPGARGSTGTAFPMPGAGGQLPPGAVAGGLPPGVDPAMLGQIPAADPSGSVGQIPGVPPSNPSTDPATGATGRAPDLSALEQGNYLDPMTVQPFLQPTLRGGVAIVATQQARAVVPRTLEGRC